MLVQLVCAACTPEFQGPLVQAMPTILPSLVTLTVCVYVLEFLRRGAFLQIVRAMQLAQDIGFEDNHQILNEK